MASNQAIHEVLFPEWYDERAEWESEMKGWLQGVRVKLANGAVFPLFFFDPVRLAQDLEMATKLGEPYIAEHGLIVIPEVTRSAILTAVGKLVEAKFFESPNSSAETISLNGLPSATTETRTGALM